MQIGIIKSLKKILKEDLFILTQIPIAAYPKERKICLCSGSIRLTNDIHAEKVPFLNIFCLKQMFLLINTFILICNWSRRNLNKNKIIICYNAFPFVSIPAVLASKIFNIRTICIFADPPIDSEKGNTIRRLAKYTENVSFTKYIKQFSGLIVLNEDSIRKYAPKLNYILIDGGFDVSETPINPPGGQWLNINGNDKLRIVFSGALVEYNGIKNLVSSLQYVKNTHISLEIYGLGPLEDYVINASQIDKRIKYMGNVPNSEMLKIQQNAGILINPRPVNDRVSQYTFPSKMIEYLLSGTPVITTKLNGLSIEYLNNVFAINGEKPTDIAETIELVLTQDKEYLVQKATKAREFIENEKSWDNHSYKIMEFIRSLI